MMSSTLLPFLYHTRTIQRALRAPFGVAIARSIQTTSIRPSRPKKSLPKDNSIPFDLDNSHAELTSVPKIDHDASHTITPTEMNIFDQIFTDIARNKQVPAQSAGSPESSRSAATPQRQGRDLAFLPDRATVLEKYPPSLRHVAEVALGLREQTVADAAVAVRRRIEPDPKLLEQAREHAALREEDRTRIAALMGECASDADLWDLLEREVFSMPGRMGLVAGKAEAADKPAPLSLDVHGPLFPELLLSALKMLRRDFGPPSLLSFNILPRTRELGLVAYVLGISTPLFNELISLSWELHGNLAGTLDLLSEMEYVGLNGDEGTMKALTRIEESLAEMDKGPPQAFPTVLMAMPEYDSSLRSALSWRLKTIANAISTAKAEGDPER